jgi:hypothetical protein
MTTTINHNGCSICEPGRGKYTKCVLGAFRGNIYYQYDYRHTDGELFSTLRPTLDGCREERDEWLQAKNAKRLLPSTLQKMEAGKRLTKHDMGYQIAKTDPYHVMAISWDYFTRAEIVTTFNRIFGTEIR